MRIPHATPASLCKRIGAYAAIAGVSLLSAGAAQAEPARTTTDLSLRAGPSTDYQRLTVMPQGVQVDVTRCTPDQGWCELTYRGYEGWSSAAYLAIQGNAQRAEPLAEVQVDLPVPLFDFFGSATEAQEPRYPQNDTSDEQTTQPAPTPAVARDEVCFYADFDYRGESVCLNPTDANPSLSRDWNDRVSSVRTGADTAVLVCENFDYTGRCRRIEGEVEAFSGGWNDVISSYEVGGTRASPGGEPAGDTGDDANTGAPEPVGQVCFYQDYDFGGASQCLEAGESMAEMSGNWNDAISSIQLDTDVEVQVCEDWNYNGNCRLLDADVTALEGNFNDAISSARARSAGWQ